MAQLRELAEAALTFFDRSLKGRSWLVGNTCTLADIGCWGRMVFMAEGGFDIGRWPSIAAWSHRLASLPGFALPYDLIPKRDQEMGPTSAAGDDKLAAGHRPRDGDGGSGTGGETS
jgi:glutathione S-transferase